MDVVDAIDSRIACRRFLPRPVEYGLLRTLIRTAGRAASSGNLQPWNVYALTGDPLHELKREAVKTIDAAPDWRKLSGEYPDFPENLCEPFAGRHEGFGAQLYAALGTARHDHAARLEQIKRNFNFFGAPVGLFITIDRRLGPGQWADLGGYVNTFALVARAYGLDSCPQVLWIRLSNLVRQHVGIPMEQILYCGMSVGYGDRSHPVNQFRTERESLDKFCRFVGFD
jgi:nitroreductase